MGEKAVIGFNQLPDLVVINTVESFGWSKTFNHTLIQDIRLSQQGAETSIPNFYVYETVEFLYTWVNSFILLVGLGVVMFLGFNKFQTLWNS